MTTWEPYRPTPEQPWSSRRVAHLHRRAAFGATWQELQRDLQDRPQDAVSRVLAGEVRSGGVPDQFEQVARLIETAAAEQPNAERLKAAWIYRILFTPHPLRERLTLMWHNHFATSNLKVDDLALMQRQIQTLRDHAESLFGDLLVAMLRDPALLMWLDAPSNRSGHPNENLGRELMELFTLGIGNYSESDVKNASRALTGITVNKGEYRFAARRHDDDVKTVLGRTGRFGPEQLAGILLQAGATARRLADRLITEFFSEGVVTEAARSALAAQLSSSQLNVGKAVATILRSRLFFCDANINTRICDPVSFVVAPIRALELFERPPSTLALSGWLGAMGMDLFYPPNVAGWRGGRTWLTSRTVIARANYAAALVSGRVHRPVCPPDFERLSKRHAAGKVERFGQMMTKLLLGDAADAPPAELVGLAVDSNESDVVLKLLTGLRAHLH